MSAPKGRVLDFFFENSVFLIVGTVAGLVWANADHASYEQILHAKIWANHWIGTIQEGGGRVINPHFLINDVLMALFFAMAGREVWESMLPGGHLSNPRKAATPIVAAVGGMIGPAVIYIVGALMIVRFSELGRGWAVPCATDIAFSYLVARFIFGAKHPAVAFLLLLAIADDALGLLILAVFYPQEELRIIWLLLPLGAVAIGFFLRELRLHRFWWYLVIPGTISWFGFALAGLHPALALLPIIPILPHKHVNKQLFNWEDLKATNTLRHFEDWWRNPVEIVLGFFGFMNAGVQLSAIGAPTFLVLAGLLAGKPVGIWISAMVASKVLRLGLPAGIGTRELLVVGCVAGIGFTVALFVSTVAFPPGQVQDAAKMGALGSFAAAIVAIVAAKLLRVRRS